MSYRVDFKGYFEYKEEQAVEEVLQIVDKESEDPEDDFERSALVREDFKKEGTKLLIDFSASIPASSWYGCMSVFYKISEQAIKGEVKCSFEGDQPEWVYAGGDY